MNADQLADKLNELLSTGKLNKAAMITLFRQADILRWESGCGEVAVYMNDNSVVAYERGRGWSVYR